jgi:SAM-dependent methyltransferase
MGHQNSESGGAEGCIEPLGMKDIDELRAYYTALIPYYDASLDERGDLPFWDSIARRWGSKRILELGCGTGRVTEVLSRHAAVTAVDLLIEMIRHASRRAPTASLVVADLREFAFTSTFDLVVLAGDPTAHLTSTDERTRVMELIADHLNPQGRVVFEGLYRPAGKPSLVSARHVRRNGEQPFEVEEWWTPAGGDSTWKATSRIREGSSIVEIASVQRSWTLRDIQRLESALQIEHLWGDFDERPFSESAARMVIVATKKRSDGLPIA